MAAEGQRSAVDLDRAVRLVHRLRENLGRVVKGHEAGLDLIVAAILARGHILLESVPGEGKTLVASSLAASIAGVSCGRISGQPTLKPSDVLGAEVMAKEAGRFELIRGPLFNHIVLFDELNRTDPRAQSALLEAMQEYRVTIGEKTHPLPRPFHVIATQNPLSHEGTWELDAAAEQRFLVKIRWMFAPREVEFRIAKEARADLAENLEGLEPVITREELLAVQDLVQRAILIPDPIIHLINAIVVGTRPTDPSYPAEVLERAGFGRDVISPEGGVSSRASSFWPPLLRAHALFCGRGQVVPYDVFATAYPLLNHRLETNYPVDLEALLQLILAERGYAYDLPA